MLYAMNLFDRVGGAQVISAIVEDFYIKVLGDSELAPYFGGTEIERLKSHQRKFIAAALGGPELYTGRPLQEVHAHLRIKPLHFDRVVEYLSESFKVAGVDPSIIDAVHPKLRELKGQIVHHI
jgi:hemoglobin